MARRSPIPASPEFAGYADSTAAVYQRCWRLYVLFCKKHKRPYFPTTPETLVFFIEQSSKVLKINSVSKRLDTVSAAHRPYFKEDPTQAHIVKIAKMKAFRRNPRRPTQKIGLTYELLQKLLAVCPNDLKGLRDRAILSVLYEAALRRSEVERICVHHVQVSEDGSGTLLIPVAKNDQTGHGHLRYLTKGTLKAIFEWQDASKIEEGVLFRSMKATGRDCKFWAPLDKTAISRLIKRRAKKAGFSQELISGLSSHSGRIGAAQDMAAAGIDIAAIMQTGNWRTSSMVARYIEKINVRSSGAAQLARIQGR